MMSAKRIVVAAMVLAATFSYVDTSQAGHSFTSESMQRTWGRAASGSVGSQSGAAVGLDTFDGVGGCSSAAHLNVGGTVTTLTWIQCTYTTRSRREALSNGTVGPFIADVVIVEAKGELDFIVSDGFDGGTVASGVAKRQR